MVSKLHARSRWWLRAAHRTAGSAPILLVSLVLMLTASSSDFGSSPDPSQRLRDVLLGTPGERILCPGCPDEPAIRVDAATGQSTEVPLPYERVNDIAPVPGGDRIIASTSSEKGKRSQLLILSSASLAPVGRVEISGNGKRVIVSPDGYLAYVISHHPGHFDSPDDETGEWELLAVDLGKSRTVESYPLSGAAYDLAITPGGERIFLGLDGKIQSFATAPLTASWFFRSPGKNRRLMVRPRQGQVYALRGAGLAIFPPEPQKPTAGEEASGDDDALQELNPPVHLNRLGFSPDGRFAVGAGRAMDVLVMVDAVRAKITGTWPEDSAAVVALLSESDAAEQPRGPRGKLLAQSRRFEPPLGAPARPDAADPSSVGDAPSRAATGEEPGESPSSATRDRSAQASPPKAAVPGPEPAPVGGKPRIPPPPTLSPMQNGSAQASPPGMAAPGPEPAPVSEKPLVVPPKPQVREITPEVASLEEVAGELLSGKISGDLSRVVWVMLFGPNSLTALRDRVAPGPDGSFSFTLPPKGKYRILLAGKPGTSVVSRPPYQSLEVGEYGFAGIDFKVVGAWGGESP